MSLRSLLAAGVESVVRGLLGLLPRSYRDSPTPDHIELIVRRVVQRIGGVSRRDRDWITQLAVDAAAANRAAKRLIERGELMDNRSVPKSVATAHLATERYRALAVVDVIDHITGRRSSIPVIIDTPTIPSAAALTREAQERLGVEWDRYRRANMPGQPGMFDQVNVRIISLSRGW